MSRFLLIALAGALGVALRYALTLALPRDAAAQFPWATLLANVLGCAAMGAILALFSIKFPNHENLRLALTVGLLGGFTTFSAFAADAITLLDADRALRAILYVAASVALSLAAAFVAFRAASAALA